MPALIIFAAVFLLSVFTGFSPILMVLLAALAGVLLKGRNGRKAA